MPFLQSSGAISINNIKTLFGGPASPALSNYYRGGAYIPSTKTTTTTVREPTSGEYWTENVTTVRVDVSGFDAGGTTGSTAYYWFSSVVYSAYGNIPSVTTGGYTYYRGSFRKYIYDSTYGITVNFFGIYRTSQSTTTVNINTNIPTSGQISISQFYGAEKP